MQSVEKVKHPYFFFGFYCLICLPPLMFFIYFWLVKFGEKGVLEKVMEGVIFILVPVGLKIFEILWRLSAARLVRYLVQLLVVGLLVLSGVFINIYTIVFFIMIDFYSAFAWSWLFFFIINNKRKRDLAGLINLGKVGVFILLLMIFFIVGNTMRAILCTIGTILYALLSAWWFLPKAVQRVDLAGERV